MLVLGRRRLRRMRARAGPPDRSDVSPHSHPQEGYSGACSSDAGCRALTASAAAFEAACWEVFDVPPACPHGCRAAVSAVGAACSGELLVWQEALNLTVWSQMLEACDVPQPSG